VIICNIIGGLNPGSQTITATGAGSFSVPAYTSKLRVRGWGGGGGGYGSNTANSVIAPGSSGTATTFNAPSGTLTANPGEGAGVDEEASQAAGGTATGGDVNTSGEAGGITDALSTADGYGGAAGGTAYGGGARKSLPSTASQNGHAGNPYGGGGTGANSNSLTYSGGGGAGFFEKIYYPGELSAGSTVGFNVGAGGPGGVPVGGTVREGGDGADGALVIEWDYE
jgi:hypothetical protein